MRTVLFSHVKPEERSLHGPLCTWQCMLLSIPAAPSGVWGILHGSLFNVLCKSCGEITQARSLPFATDGMPLQRDYDALDLLSFSFLLKPSYQLSVSPALWCLDGDARISAVPSPGSGRKFPSISVIHGCQAKQ